MNIRDAGDPDNLGVREILARTAAFEFDPPRDLLPAALKRVRLRRKAVEQTNEFFGAFVGLGSGLGTLWSADPIDEAHG